jgi:hypothetical protein
MNDKSLAPQTPRKHEQDVAREPQSMEQNDGLGSGVRYGKTSSLGWLTRFKLGFQLYDDFTVGP